MASAGFGYTKPLEILQPSIAVAGTGIVNSANVVSTKSVGSIEYYVHVSAISGTLLVATQVQPDPDGFPNNWVANTGGLVITTTGLFVVNALIGLAAIGRATRTQHSMGGAPDTATIEIQAVTSPWHG
jgi:hypothetical protein